MILCVNTFMHSVQNTAKFINATLWDYTLLKCPTMSVLKHNKVKKKTIVERTWLFCKQTSITGICTCTYMIIITMCIYRKLRGATEKSSIT